MKRKLGIVIVVIISIIVILGIASKSPSDIEKKSTVFHITLANPELYTDGIYSSSFLLPKGEFSLSFVPNGDSPENLGIVISGATTIYDQKLVLDGTLHQGAIAEYYTWDYSGITEFENLEEQSVLIEIDPHGNLLGTLSININTPEFFENNRRDPLSTEL